MMLSHRKDSTNAQRQAQFRRRKTQQYQEALEAKGLPKLPAISSLPGTTRWKAQYALVQSTLEDMRDQMQDYFDDRTERWQESDRGEAMSQRLEELDDILAIVDDFQFT